MKKYSSYQKKSHPNHNAPRFNAMPVVAEIDVTTDERMVSVPVGVFMKMIAAATLLDVVSALANQESGTYIKVSELRGVIGVLKERKAHE